MDVGAVLACDAALAANYSNSATITALHDAAGNSIMSYSGGGYSFAVGGRPPSSFVAWDLPGMVAGPDSTDRCSGIEHGTFAIDICFDTCRHDVIQIDASAIWPATMQP